MNWIRINRDELRLMCGDYWVLTRESLINIYEETLVKEALNKGYNVIIDATNLNPKTVTKWTKIASDFDCALRFKEFIIPYMEAIKRDKNRHLVVGEDAIRSFYLRYYPDYL